MLRYIKYCGLVLSGLVLLTVIVLWAIGVQHDSMSGNSMSPNIKRGDLIITKKTNTVKIGDRVRFFAPHQTVATTHRIVDVQDITVPGKSPERIYITKGDANPTNDAYFLSDDSVKEKVVMVVPGYKGVWKTAFELQLPVVVVAILALMAELVPWERFLQWRPATVPS